jgi:transcriptional regulator GlxA family with amidase domain
MSGRLDSAPGVDGGGGARDASRMSNRAIPPRPAPKLRLVRDDGANGTDRAGALPPNDEYVARALRAMKADPARRWTVAALSRAAGLSRAPFARRFRRATGTSPLRFLTEHRLELAQALLAAEPLTLAAVAAAVGYSSEFALSKAFKRVFGIAPAVFRRARRAAVTSRAASGATPRFRAAA